MEDMAAANGNIEIVSYLIEKQADLNIQNKKGNTALRKWISLKWSNQYSDWAAFNNHKEIVELLLSKGASTLLKNKFGRFPHEEAQERQNFEIGALIEAEYIKNCPEEEK